MPDRGARRHLAPPVVPADAVEFSLVKACPSQEIRRRAPWLVISVAAGFAMMMIGEAFDASLAHRIQIAFFLPTIVYMSDIIGTEVLALVVRELAFRTVRLEQLLRRELRG